MGDHVVDVCVELVPDPHDDVLLVDNIGVQPHDLEDVFRPQCKLLPVLGRRAKKRADDRDRVGPGDVGNEVAPAGIGDLIVTCTSPASRNRRVGEELGTGKTIAEVLAGMNQVAEGVKTVSVVMDMAGRLGIDMPIATEVHGVINHGNTADEAYRGLLRSTPGHEVHGEGW